MATDWSGRFGKCETKNSAMITGCSQRRFLLTGLLFLTRNYGGIKKKKNDRRIGDAFVEDLCVSLAEVDDCLFSLCFIDISLKFWSEVTKRADLFRRVNSPCSVTLPLSERKL
ncbi:hypothetical protein CDAR_267951 [Caerostris darwini]|uniref:Uncharacterized protein n=1 Tax=Caerostris darwini TaxID=1538125 RepID=A0AAV4RR04_9ARAC|nr:hypothetical protein CDAR_267951 [Caerostris darwini]